MILWMQLFWLRVTPCLTYVEFHRFATLGGMGTSQSDLYGLFAQPGVYVNIYKASVVKNIVKIVSTLKFRRVSMKGKLLVSKLSPKETQHDSLVDSLGASREQTRTALLVQHVHPVGKQVIQLALLK